jgi:uncharacterized RDD family membrane protein YckC
MKTIDKLTVEQTFYKRHKDAFGNVTREPYTKMVPRKVRIVETGPRIGYWLLDTICILLLTGGAIFTCFALIEDRRLLSEVVNFLAATISLVFYFLFEFFYQQTPGKMILGYVVINDKAHDPTMRDIAIRTICRMLPFEAFSCFSENGGWHDRFSQTYVVSKKERIELRRLMGGIGEMDVQLLDQ